MATVLGHHPAYHMGACYSGPFEVSEYEVIGGYLREPLRLTGSATWGDDFLIPADAEIVIEGVLKPGKRMVEGPFGEAPGYLGPQRYLTCPNYEVRAINYRNGAMYQSVITPEGDKPWMDLPREGAYLRRCREAVPGVTAVCKQGRHAHYNVFISMKKMSEGDPGRAAAAALTFDHTKNVFVFDDDIDVFNPTDILWAFATRVQPHLQVNILMPLFRGNLLDPSLRRRDQDFRNDRRCDHGQLGPTVLAGVEVPRRSDGADQARRLRARRSAVAYSHGPDDVLGLDGFRTISRLRLTRRRPFAYSSSRRQIAHLPFPFTFDTAFRQQ